MPKPVPAVVVLALLTRVRAARIASGEISAARLYDVRAFKCALAELGYLRTLTRRPTGGTIVTAMTQLVKGLARLHPAWRMTGDKFADRDRHQQAVRRRLRDLDAMGVLRWTIGVDVDGEDARTELQLLSAPDVTDEELAAAAAQLARWRVRYGAALNTGSSTGIRNAARHARPLSASVRERRGVARTRARARSRGDVSTSNSAPHFVAPATPENSQELSSHAEKLRSVCGPRTGARAQQDDTNSSCLSRPDAPPNPDVVAAVSAAETASLRMGGTDRPGEIAKIDVAALLERVAARQVARQPVLDVIAAQAASRAVEVATWSLERGWPMGRIREAWVVWRYGAMCAAEQSAATAGPLEHDDHDRLRRAAARYERHATARPRGFPELGLAALAQIAAIADERNARPLTLHYGIRRLDQVSRRMRASASADDATRRDRQAVRARRRRHPDQPGLRFAFRTSRWPAWVALDDRGDPVLENHDLVVIHNSLGIVSAPDRNDPEYKQTLRDACLLAGLWPPIESDGRATMALGDDREYEQPHRRARPGPYPPPDDRRASPEADDLELARRADIPLHAAKRVSPDVRDQMLEELRAEQREQHAVERIALWNRLAAAQRPSAADDA